jgi:gas vesicle protein
MNPRPDEIHGGWLANGLVIGVIAGAAAALALLPISGKALRRRLFGQIGQTGESLRGTARSIVPRDPVSASLAEGKAAARRRQDLLGG